MGIIAGITGQVEEDFHAGMKMVTKRNVKKAKAVVMIKKLHSCREQKTYTEYRPLDDELKREIRDRVGEIFDFFGGENLLKSSRDVYIKPNAVDAKPYAFTRPEILEAVIAYWKEKGARKVYVFENSTVCNLTRLVFEMTGYAKICRKTGAIPIYLDEDETEALQFSNDSSLPEGYDSNRFRISKTVYEKLILRRNENLYINLPKLKTHSMGVVTLGIKNQWAFPCHEDRGFDHNFNLHSKLADVLSHITPDFTLIEGVEGSIYGHYNALALALADVCVRRFGILIGSDNVVAADIIGSRIFGYDIREVPHIQLAVRRGLSGGVRSMRDIGLEGDYNNASLDIIGDRKKFGGKYPFDLYPDFPPDVQIVKGHGMACREGCVNNPLAVLQSIYKDCGGHGGWTLVMGKGFTKEDIARIRGRVLLAGHCAIEELYEDLKNKLGKRNVYCSGKCNDLRATTEAMCHLMKVNPMKLAPINPLKALYCIAQAKRNKSHGMLVNPFAHIIKLH